MKIKTEHRGAGLERQAILAKIRRMRKHPDISNPCYLILFRLEKWIEKRVKRFKSKKGGL